MSNTLQEEAPRNTSHKHRCIFIHIPKAAGTSIKHALDMPGRGHLAWAYYSLCYPQLWQQYTSFTVVRNPWDRAVSIYHWAKVQDSYWFKGQLVPIDYELLASKSFEECLTILDGQRERLKSEAWHRQTVWVAGPKSLGGKVMVDRVLRFENLDHDFPKFCEDLGIEQRSLPKMNPSNRSRDYRQYYNDATRKLVERIYEPDIETFGYSF
ncbi:MAG: sulfotransferase family 2 domain-containing protein [Pirellulales bacterium]